MKKVGRAARGCGVKFFLRRHGPLWYVAVESPIYLGGVRFHRFPSFDAAWEWQWESPPWASLGSG